MISIQRIPLCKIWTDFFIKIEMFENCDLNLSRKKIKGNAPTLLPYFPWRLIRN